MKPLLLLFLFLTPLYASELICRLVDKPDSSEMKIVYKDFSPVQIFLRSPGSFNYREVDFNIQSITMTEDIHAFNASPKSLDSVDWDNEPFCYKKLGTQWFFNFFFDRDSFVVYFMPYFQTKSFGCVTPQAAPQRHTLSCEYLSP